MIGVRELGESFLHILFPHVCAGCGNDLPGNLSQLCLKCLNHLPQTYFEAHAHNPVEKKFWGRLPIAMATACYYFTRESLMQHLMHQFKYRGNKDLGLQLGRLMGTGIRDCGRFNVDVLVPLPLFASKEKLRGFNQATLLCEGMSEILNLPVLNNTVNRSKHTDTQTRKGRIERWQNMEGKFVVSDPLKLQGKHVLLVDDVITTGATLEACGETILTCKDVELSVATLCFTSR